MVDFSWVFDATTPSTLLAAVKAMSPADIINGLFETMGGFFISLSIRKLHADKKVRGVSWVHAAFFSSWGYWNLYFYPHLDQWFSFAGGAFLVAANTFWLCQMWYWLSVERAALADAAGIRERAERSASRRSKVCPICHQDHAMLWPKAYEALTIR